MLDQIYNKNNMKNMDQFHEAYLQTFEDDSSNNDESDDS